MDGIPLKIPVVTKLHYVIYLEPFCDRVWVHTDIFKWTARIKDQFIQDLNKIPGPLYALSTTKGGEKRNKFIESLGDWKRYSTNEFGAIYRRA